MSATTTDYRAEAQRQVADAEGQAEFFWRMQGGGSVGYHGPSLAAYTDKRLRERLEEVLAEEEPMRQRVERIEEEERDVLGDIDDAVSDALCDAERDDEGLRSIQAAVGAVKAAEGGGVARELLELVESVVQFYHGRVFGLIGRIELLEAERSKGEVSVSAQTTEPAKSRTRRHRRPALGSTTIPLRFDISTATHGSNYSESPNSSSDTTDPDSAVDPTTLCTTCPLALTNNDGRCERHGRRVQGCWDGDRLLPQSKWRDCRPSALPAPAPPEKRKRGRPRKAAQAEVR